MCINFRVFQELYVEVVMDVLHVAHTNYASVGGARRRHTVVVVCVCE